MDLISFNWFKVIKLVQIGSKIGLWATWALGNLDFGQLKLWVTCFLGGDLDFWQFGQLELWVTWALSNLDFVQLGLWAIWAT